jgi:hypothetical protein
MISRGAQKVYIDGCYGTMKKYNIPGCHRRSLRRKIPSKINLERVVHDVQFATYIKTNHERNCLIGLWNYRYENRCSVDPVIKRIHGDRILQLGIHLVQNK